MRSMATTRTFRDHRITLAGPVPLKPSPLLGFSVPAGRDPGITEGSHGDHRVPQPPLLRYNATQ